MVMKGLTAFHAIDFSGFVPYKAPTVVSDGESHDDSGCTGFHDRRTSFLFHPLAQVHEQGKHVSFLRAEKGFLGEGHSSVA